MIFHAQRSVGTALVIVMLTSPAAGASAAENLAAQVKFEATMARKMGDVCAGFTFDEAGYAAYLASMAESVGRDTATFTAEVETATDADALVPYYEAFILRHGGDLFSNRPAFCKAGAREVDEATGIGRMIKRKGN